MSIENLILTINNYLDGNPDVRKKFENALAELISSYRTNIYENRFIVGGVTERLFLLLMNKSGIQCKLVGEYTVGYDILILEDNSCLSIKYSSKGDIKIFNSLGANKLLTPQYDTIFILPDKGYIYGISKEKFSKKFLINQKDGLSLKRIFFKNIKVSNKNAISIDINIDNLVAISIASDDVFLKLTTKHELG